LLSLFGLFRPDAPLLEQPHVSLLAGLPVLLAALALAAWRLYRLRRVPARVVALVTGIIAFWVLTGIQRGLVAPPGTPRYVYVGSLVLLLIAAELAHGAVLRRRVVGALVLVAAAGAAYNVPLLREAAAGLRGEGEMTRVALGVLEIAEPNVRSGEVLTIIRGYPFVLLTTGRYFAAERAWGQTLAATPSEIAGASPPARQQADQELARIERASVRPAAGRRPLGAPPQVDRAAAGPVTHAGACLSFARRSSRSPAAIDVTLPREGVLVRAGGGPATIRVRRFGDLFQAEPLATVRRARTVYVSIRPDRAPQPWHVRVEAQRAATVCSA
jgi:hypothetical protein